MVLSFCYRYTYNCKGYRTLDDFLSADKKSSVEFRQSCDKIGACRAISDNARSQNVLSGLIGWCAVDQDNLSGLARTSTNEELSSESREQASFPTRRRSTWPQA